MTRGLLLALAALSAGAVAKEKAPPPPPVDHPGWAELRSDAEASMRRHLVDPGSAQIEWTSGFEWGSTKRPFQAREWAWVACVSINAKNRMGGYTGAEPHYVRYRPAEGVTWGPIALLTTQCDRETPVPLQPELRGDAAAGVVGQAGR